MEGKKDKILGDQIYEDLTSKRVETPAYFDNFEIDEEKINRHFKIIMQEIGMDLSDDSLFGTPARVAKMFSHELFYGLNYENFPKCTTVENKMDYDEMICSDKIKVSSVCEHHFVTIDGHAKVAYIPNKEVLGLSKINRVVDFFSRRPQIQERLTEQIYFALKYILKTDNIAVKIVAVHHCVKQRGIMDANSFTTTQKLGGAFKSDPATRSEFINF